jgi:hypothetical protein
VRVQAGCGIGYFKGFCRPGIGVRCAVKGRQVRSATSHSQVFLRGRQSMRQSRIGARTANERNDRQLWPRVLARRFQTWQRRTRSSSGLPKPRKGCSKVFKVTPDLRWPMAHFHPKRRRCRPLPPRMLRSPDLAGLHLSSHRRPRARRPVRGSSSRQVVNNGATHAASI